VQFRLITLLLLFVLLWASLNVFGIGWGVAVFGGTIALALYLRWGEPDFWIGKALLVLVGFVAALILLSRLPDYLWPPHICGKFPACNNNMHYIAMVLHTYEKANGHLPPAYIADKNGRPMHSWCVLLLPYMDSEGEALYKRYDFNEPWNGPNNRKLIPLMPDWYCCPQDDPAAAKAGYTNYFAVVGPQSCWRGEKPMTLKDIRFTSQTIMLVEAAGAKVAWTEPRDFDVASLSLPNPPMKISSRHVPETGFCFHPHAGGAYVARADWPVHFLPQEMLASDRLPDMLKIGGFSESDWDAAVNVPRRFDWPKFFALVIWFLSVVWLQRQALRGRWQMMREAESSPPPKPQSD
jgi:hypothetical protein